MIPTTVISSPSTSAASNFSSCSGQQSGTTAAMIGIASLILEGRAVAEDEFLPQAVGPNALGCGNNEHCAPASGSNFVTEAGVGQSEQQSPKPSTSRAAASSSIHCKAQAINIITNPQHAYVDGCPMTATTPFMMESHYCSSASSSAENTHQRWAQKLCQLRQASPVANLSPSYEQKVVAETHTLTVEPEIIALAINESNCECGSEFEVVRRMMLNHANASVAASSESTSSSPGSGPENFLHSLQSLATTCLRGSGPSNMEPSYRYSTQSATLATPSTPTTASPSSKYQTYRTATPSRFQRPLTRDVTASNSSNGSGIQSPKTAWSSLNYLNATTMTTTTTTTTTTTRITSSSPNTAGGLLHQQKCRIPISVTATHMLNSASCNTSIAARMPTKRNNLMSPHPQQGPHCDQFLKKMGLAKGETFEAEDHICDMSYINITCSRWRAYCLKMEAIMERGEPICIEVYLGPVGHKILLEQWIITQAKKTPPPTMTLSSLCSAIRSQLYFSQVSAWTDLIKKSDKVHDTGRIIYPTATGAAGDLATLYAAGTGVASLPETVSASTTPVYRRMTNLAYRRPRLNIFYRIKAFDSTACFNLKPNVHNFPNVNISENSSISVCLKSLPRINGGIPKIGAEIPATSTPTLPLTSTLTNISEGGKAMRDENRRIASAGNQRNVSVTSPSSTSTNVIANMDRIKMAPAPLLNIIEAKTSMEMSMKTTTTTTPIMAPAPAMAMAMATATATTTSVSMSMLRAACPAISTTCDINGIQTVFGENSSSLSDCQSNGVDATGTLVPPSTEANEKYCEESHKCLFFIDDEELVKDLGETDGLEEDISIGDAINSCTDISNSSLSAYPSHREKQLLKYRKRILKRDRKNRKVSSNSSCEMIKSDNYEDQMLGLNAPERSVVDAVKSQPMEQGEEELESKHATTLPSSTALTASNRIVTSPRSASVEMISTGTQTLMSCCQQCGSEKTLVCLQCGHSSYQNGGVEVSSESTQNAHQLPDEMEDDCSSISSMSSSEIIRTPRNKAELLLQAIQRTPKVAKHKKQFSRFGACQPVSKQMQNNNHLNGVHTVVSEEIPSLENGNNVNSSGVVGGGGGGGGITNCQVCKRQKTQHNFTMERSDDINPMKVDYVATKAERVVEEKEESENAEDEDDDDGGKGDTNFKSSMTLHCAPEKKALSNIMEEESFFTSTKLTPHNDCYPFTSCSSSENVSLKPDRDDRCYTPPNFELNATAAVILAEFKTPTNDEQHKQQEQEHEDQPQPQSQQQQQQRQQQKHQLKQKPKHKQAFLQKPTLSPDLCSNDNCKGAGDGFCKTSNELVCSTTYQSTPKALSAHDVATQRKGLPKVNLTPIFCNPLPSSSLSTSFSSPIPINGKASSCTSTSTSNSNSNSNSNAFLFDSTAINHLSRHQLNVNSNTAEDNFSVYIENNIPVQKSYSAPTLPNSPSLSPRFAKQAAIYKRRSRHLSDRSDRSSLGSDEQFSDEDLESNNLYSPATSPIKSRSRIAAVFGRQPLLGNLEESLLQKRLKPKVEVVGFKVLLGASGGFCPTQLTIPAVSYFYELHGQTLSTPYVCEIRLPRKGYFIPRSGTVQATLLNPVGTVVRMFVIPYDMSDMPPLHQTFIRQRILAEASYTGAEAINVLKQSNCFSEDLDESSINYNNNNNNAKNNNKYHESNLGHFISAEHMKRLRYSIHLRFQTSRSGRLSLHTDIRLLISRRTDCDTAAAHAKGALEAPNDLVTDTVMPTNPKYSARQEANTNKI